MLTIITILLSIVLILFDNGFGQNTEIHMPSRYGFAEYTTESRQHHPSSMLCMNLKPQHSVDINNISGLWYGNEIIMHTQDLPGIYQYHSCVRIHITDVTDEIHDYQYNYHTYKTMAVATTGSSGKTVHQSTNDDYDVIAAKVRYIRLLWSENDFSIEYNFNYTTNRPGVWASVGEQRGSLADLNQYTQFTGSVQVVNAMNNHLVLTFCASDMHHSIYTIVLSREARSLKLDVLRSIRNLLSKRGLYTESIRKVCEQNMHSGQKSIKPSLSWFSFVPAFVFLFSLACILKKFH